MPYDQDQYKADLKAKRWCQFVPKNERPVISAMIKAILKAGHSVSICDGAETVVDMSKDASLIKSQLGHTGEDYINIMSKDGECIGWFYLIYNNGSDEDPMIVISDHTCGIFEDAVYIELHNKYGG